MTIIDTLRQIGLPEAIPVPGNALDPANNGEIGTPSDRTYSFMPAHHARLTDSMGIALMRELFGELLCKALHQIVTANNGRYTTVAIRVQTHFAAIGNFEPLMYGDHIYDVRIMFGTEGDGFLMVSAYETQFTERGYASTSAS